MTTFALPFSVSLPASRSCKQKNGGLLSSLCGLRPVLHLAIQGPSGRENFTYCGETHTHTHTRTLAHNLYKTRATTTIEGRGLLPRALECVYPYSEWMCVLYWGFKGGWVPCDSHGLQGDNPHTLSLTHTSQHSKTITESESFFTFRLHPVKQ